MASTVDMRSGLRAVGALRSDEERSQEPVALETAVLATGARPGDAAAKRELFTEETQTVLVFENGAVIRLSAAVADGQLLFLTNKKTGKEVVTQVIRKRSFRPTSCYVDLEFTESCPGFWGIEFPKSAATSPASAQLSEPEGDQPTAAAPAAPNQQEVERLKNEVADLQNKLKSLTGAAQVSEIVRASSAGTEPAGISASKTQLPEEQTQRQEEQTQRQEEQTDLERLLAQEAQQERLQGPQRLVGYTKKSTVTSVVKKAGKVATVGAFAAVFVSAGVAAYRFGLLDSVIGKNLPAKVATHSGSATAPSRANAASKPAPSASTNPVSSAATLNSASALTEVKPPAAENPANVARASQPNLSPEKSAVSAGERSVESTLPRKGASGSFSHASNRTATPPVTAGLSFAKAPATAPAGSLTATSEGASGEVPAKLLHAVKPVSPSEALRNYITGDVVVDALVDTGGHVKAVTVISGPEKLRNTAIEVMKQYVYEPAKKDGKAVQSHVKASLQFWYEP